MGSWFRGAGWAALVRAVLGPAAFWFMPVVGAVETRVIAAVLALVGLVLTVYVLESLRTLLAQRFGFHRVGRHITALVWLSVAGAALRFAIEAAFWASRLASGLGWLLTGLAYAGVLAGVLAAVMYIALAVSLLDLSAGLDGLLGPLCYAWMVGHGAILVVYGLQWLEAWMMANALSAAGVLARSLADVLLGLGFLRAASAAIPGRA